MHSSLITSLHNYMQLAKVLAILMPVHNHAWQGFVLVLLSLSHYGPERKARSYITVIVNVEIIGYSISLQCASTIVIDMNITKISHISTDPLSSTIFITFTKSRNAIAIPMTTAQNDTP